VVRSTAGDADAAVHPDGKDLVFVSTRSGRAEIWFSDADGRNARRFLTSGPQGGSLSWSNNGRFLAFDVHSEKGADVYLVGRDGARPRRVDTGHGFSAVPTFSHDSRFLYFTTNINDEFAGARMALNDEGEPAGKAEPLPAPGGGVFRRESPDGKYLVYSKGFSVGALYARELRGGPERKIVDGLVHWSNFAVTNAGVYFVEQPPTGTTSADSNYAASGNSIRFYQFADGKTEVLKVLDAPVSEGFSMDAAGRRLYWSQVDQQNVDLKLSRLSR
jgi:Tol biopolymer transport system component